MSARRWQQGLWVSWLGILTVLIVWQVVNSLQIVNPRVFPGPLAVFETALTRFPVQTLLGHVGASLARVAAGFALGAALAISIGIISGWYRVLGKMLWGPIEILRPIPPLAWIPIALIWFGLGESSKVFIIFLGAFFPIVTNTYKGMATIDPMLIRAAQTMGVRGLRMLVQVAIPASLPDIAVGIRVGWSLSFGSLVAAEILAADRGLGYMIMYARELGEINVIVYGIILIGALNLTTDFLIYKFLFKRQLRWHFGR
jgi:ABC-type nitrate/sulfonate/bicarbonate transport system permease component